MVQKRRNHDQFPYKRASNQIKHQPWPSGICNQHTRCITDPRGLDSLHRQQTTHKRQHKEESGGSATGVKSELEEAGEEAERRADEGWQVRMLGQAGKTGVGVTLGPEEGRVDVGVDEEGDEGGDCEEDGREDEVGERKGLDWRTTPARE